SIYAYNVKKPVVRYVISSKKVARDGSDYLYQCLIGFKTEKGSVVVNALYLNTPTDVVPQPDPESKVEMDYPLLVFPEKTLRITARVVSKDFPTFATAGRAYAVQFR